MEEVINGILIREVETKKMCIRDRGISGRKLFERFPEIRNQLWKGELWNHSYYVETVGSVSYGIPQFRLPKEIVQHEISALKKLGVKIVVDKGRRRRIFQFSSYCYSSLSGRCSLSHRSSFDWRNGMVCLQLWEAFCHKVPYFPFALQ